MGLQLCGSFAKFKSDSLDLQNSYFDYFQCFYLKLYFGLNYSPLITIIHPTCKQIYYN